MVDRDCQDVLPSILWWRDIAGLARKNLMQCAAEEPAVIFALVGIANAVLAARTPNHRRAEGIMRCRYQTVLHIRKKLNTAATVSHSTIYAIALLLRLEVGRASHVVL